MSNTNIPTDKPVNIYFATYCGSKRNANDSSGILLSIENTIHGLAGSFEQAKELIMDRYGPDITILSLSFVSEVDFGTEHLFLQRG